MIEEANMIRSLQRRVARLEAEGATTLSPRARRQREEWLRQQPEFNVFFNSEDTVQRVTKLQTVYWADFFSD